MSTHYIYTCVAYCVLSCVKGKREWKKKMKQLVFTGHRNGVGYLRLTNRYCWYNIEYLYKTNIYLKLWHVCMTLKLLAAFLYYTFIKIYCYYHHCYYIILLSYNILLLFAFHILSFHYCYTKSIILFLCCIILWYI